MSKHQKMILDFALSKHQIGTQNSTFPYLKVLAMEEKYKIHSIYILSILLSTIVILITIKWSNIPGLKDYISFALTVFSLGLAVIAIIYSMYSNSSLSSSLNMLEYSSKKLSDTSNILLESTKNLSENILCIPQAIEKVENRITQTHDLVKSLNLGNSSPNIINRASEMLPKNLLDEFVKSTSYNSLITLYILHHSHSNQVPIKLDDEMLNAARIQGDYNFACFILLKAMGFFKVKNISDALLCTEINPYFKGKMKEILSAKIEDVFYGQEEYIESSKSNLDNLENYLNTNYH